MIRHVKIAAASAAVLLAGAASRASAQHPQPGDRVVVRVFGGEQLLADTLLVGQNGVVVLPKLGPVVVTGFDLATLPDTLRGRYARYLRNPTVDVVVLRRITVSGEVRRPDVYYMDLAATLPDVIAHAGGLTESGSAGKIMLRRGGEVIPVRDWETGHASVATLQSGDQILVGRRSWLSQNALAVASTAAVLVSLFISLRR